VYHTFALVESRPYDDDFDDDDDDGYGAQIGDFRSRGPTWPRTAIEGEGLILYDYCHHYCFVYGPSSWSSLAIINTYTARPLTITVSPSHLPSPLYTRRPYLYRLYRFLSSCAAGYYRLKNERYIIIMIMIMIMVMIILYTIMRRVRNRTYIILYSAVLTMRTVMTRSSVIYIIGVHRPAVMKYTAHKVL